MQVSDFLNHSLPLLPRCNEYLVFAAANAAPVEDKYLVRIDTPLVGTAWNLQRQRFFLLPEPMEQWGLDETPQGRRAMARFQRFASLSEPKTGVA